MRPANTDVVNIFTDTELLLDIPANAVEGIVAVGITRAC